MAEQIIRNQDYLLDPETGDLMIADGDFVVGESDDQHIEDIVQCFAGEFKQFPQIGAGIITSLNASQIQNSINNVRSQLQAGGYSLALLDMFVDQSSKLRIRFPQGISYNR